MTDFCNDIEPRIDRIIDELEGGISGTALAKLIEDLRDIRDDIPCDCEDES